MAIVRAMWVGQGATGLPEDRFVNTFHFENADAYGDHIDAIELMLANFYFEVGAEGPPQTNAIGRYISPFVSRTSEFRFYDLSTAIPRVPTVRPFTLPTTLGSEGLPEEVALCLTLHGAPPVNARRRGRIYLGPFTVSSFTGATTVTQCRPVPSLITDLQRAAARCADPVNFPVGWSIRSTVPTQNFVPIVSGYVDNAFDTQRRRGPKAFARSTWVAGTIV